MEVGRLRVQKSMPVRVVRSEYLSNGYILTRQPALHRSTRRSSLSPNTISGARTDNGVCSVVGASSLKKASPKSMILIDRQDFIKSLLWKCAGRTISVGILCAKGFPSSLVTAPMSGLPSLATKSSSLKEFRSDTTNARFRVCKSISKGYYL